MAFALPGCSRAVCKLFKLKYAVQRELLRGHQAESAHALSRDDRPDFHSAIGDGLGLAAQRAIAGNIARRRQPHDHFVADVNVQFLGQGLD